MVYPSFLTNLSNQGVVSQFSAPLLRPWIDGKVFRFSKKRHGDSVAENYDKVLHFICAYC
jgi:hypothetical protein